MAVDNTHVKFLKGADKKAWNNYKEALEAQKKLENFMDSIMPKNIKAGEVIDIPVKRKKE